MVLEGLQGGVLALGKSLRLCLGCPESLLASQAFDMTPVTPGVRHVLTWCAFTVCLIGFFLTGLTRGSSPHPFAPLMFLLGAFFIFGLGLTIPVWPEW